jgi:hypothetical protein
MAVIGQLSYKRSNSLKRGRRRVTTVVGESHLALIDLRKFFGACLGGGVRDVSRHAVEPSVCELGLDYENVPINSPTAVPRPRNIWR